MKNYLFIFFLLSFQLAFGQETDMIIIEDVQYLDFKSNQFKKASIAIKDQKIQEISKRIKSKENVTRIDGEGKYLIPGLVDAHIHLFQSGGLYTRPDVVDLRSIRPYEKEVSWYKEHSADLMKRYLKSGITTVIDVGGPMYNFEQKKTFADVTVFPNLYNTGPLVSTYQPPELDVEDAPIVKVKSTEEAIALVQKQVPFKPDFIKIWYITLPTQSAESTYDIVKATIDESHKHNLKVAVHATQLNTAKLAIKAGADILVHSVDNPIDDEFIQMLNKNQVAYIPTLMVHRKYTEVLSQNLKFTDEDFMYAHPIPLGSLMDTRQIENENLNQYKAFAPQLNKQLEAQDKERIANLEKLNKGNALIVTGTDAGNIGTLHTSSFYEEIKDMQRAKMSNLEILKASSINAAKAFGKEHIGEIAVGKMADLVLLNKNPLEDLSALQDIEHVIKGGKAHDPDLMVETKPEDLAQQQLNAYNSRNIEAFLEPYSEDVEIYNFPNELVYKGKDKMRSRYSGMFERVKDLHCELVNRVVMGNTVIDHEKVTGFANVDVLHAIAIYKIENGKIAKVYFMK